MNYQIKQLAEEAGFLLWEDELWKPEGAIIDWSSNYDDVLDRYTELIVRECVKVMYDNAIERKVGLDIDKRPTYYAAAILEHFGVES
jgi:hypothetical protein